MTTLDASALHEAKAPPLPLNLERGPLAVAAVGGSLPIWWLVGKYPWWSGVIAGAVLLGVVVTRIAGHTLVGWIQVWWDFRGGKAARAAARARAGRVQDVKVAAGVCGIRAEGVTLAAMVQLAPNLDLPTVAGDSGAYTEDTVPLDVLAGLLHQYGVAVDIDVVTTGQRVRQSGTYGLLYDKLVSSHAVVGDRLTWLVVRLDQERNLTTLSRRGGTDSAGPKAVASAAHRIAAQLRGAGISAQVLPAAAVRQAVRQLHAGIDPGELSESWTQLTGPVESRCVTNYWVDWSQLQEDGLDECFSAGGRRTTLTVSLSSKLEPDLVAPRRGIGDVEVRGLVRYVGPAFDQPPLAYLRALGGRQSEALLASLGSGVSCAAIGVEPIAAAEVLPAPGGQDSGLTIPIGPSGQLLGSISGRPHHMLALSLFDPTPYNPRRRTVEVRATLPVAQQIILRAAAVGADVEIHTGRPDSWHQFVAAVGDARTMRLAPPPGAPNGALPATIAVFDELNPSATGAHTTVTIVEPGVAPRGPQSDITITQVSQTTVTVSIPMSTVQVDLIEPVGEARYFDLAGRRQAAPATRPQSGRPGWRDLLDPDALSAGAAVPTAATATLPGNGRTASAGGAAGAESAGEPTSAPAPGTVFPGGA